ncbi:Uncharacterized protein LW94_11340 [Fusarium fujikuroi]|nr:Uncharacterized protein LW94_11340 [Fusarium fujikuroi]
MFNSAFSPAFSLAFTSAFNPNFNPVFNAAVNPEGMGLAGNPAVHSDPTHQDGENIASDKVTGLGEESVSNETGSENSQAASVGIVPQSPLVLESVTTPWLAEADVFIEYFSRINVYHYSGTRNDALPYYVVSGGSRDPPTRHGLGPEAESDTLPHRTQAVNIPLRDGLAFDGTLYMPGGDVPTSGPPGLVVFHGSGFVTAS